MNCREFEENWNEVLDAQSPGLPELERALEAHASGCAKCRAISSQYQVLRQAVSTWTAGHAPIASAESLERLYALTVPSTPLLIPPRRSRLSLLMPLATAAALLAMAWFGWSARMSRPSAKDSAPASNPAEAIAIHRDSLDRPLGAALAEATEATIDLAREASAPAARIGREILDLDKYTESAAIENPTAFLDNESAASDLFQSVGERVNESVKPISGTARHAFSFLFPPGPEPAPAGSQGGAY